MSESVLSREFKYALVKVVISVLGGWDFGLNLITILTKGKWVNIPILGRDFIDGDIL